MDRELPDDERSRSGATIRAHPEVRGIHDLRTRASGPQIFIQCHIELESTLTLMQAHAIADAVEADLRRAFPGAEVIIHQDPYPATDATPASRTTQGRPARPTCDRKSVRRGTRVSDSERLGGG